MIRVSTHQQLAIVAMMASRRGCASAAAPRNPRKDDDSESVLRKSKEAGSSVPSSSSSAVPSPKTEEEIREALIDGLIMRDKEIFTLKRQHELSMLRVEQGQNRALKEQEDRAIYFEQNANVVTFDTISSGYYSQRSAFYHGLSWNRLRQFKIGITVGCSAALWVYLYYRYTRNPDMIYMDEPVTYFGSQAQAIRELRMREEEKRQYEKFSVDNVMKS